MFWGLKLKKQPSQELPRFSFNSNTKLMILHKVSPSPSGSPPAWPSRKIVRDSLTLSRWDLGISLLVNDNDDDVSVGDENEAVQQSGGITIPPSILSNNHFLCCIHVKCRSAAWKSQLLRLMMAAEGTVFELDQTLQILDHAQTGDKCGGKTGKVCELLPQIE